VTVDFWRWFRWRLVTHSATSETLASLDAYSIADACELHDYLDSIDEASRPKEQ